MRNENVPDFGRFLGSPSWRGRERPRPRPGFSWFGVGDFDGNRRADIMRRSKSTSDVLCWRMNGVAMENSLATMQASPS